MNNIKQVKKHFKKNGNYKTYKKLFPNHQTRFLVSLVAFDLDPNLEIKKVLAAEMLLLKKPQNKSLYRESFNLIKNILPEHQKMDFNSLAEYFWYIYQTSRYFSDQKKAVKNLYTMENYNQINSQKRTCFNHWIDSYKKYDRNYNALVIKVLKKVL